ncbi:protein required for normal CLN1 and CLN2 G1 cyclin expression [Coemansia spiralis]|uniref:Protein required for normal CLN1 and CLN2 G1 cyclin expression n=2 Tax=Coemansia TaxID=4863 RepID=A0A9W8KVC3_9FUNG|nr:protein required for normal CLN1 and CLN2 G1 cyclin expression [Coemansia umbellata]KAJ2618814.1 protein required for normal CLN1 and CLN2 G1 cyclin expression [Coemansia sp. RSA 1358]KAJ2669074.1 protein required for normal CLN1 and CLN2 G1 cyclin expression [Coemansia spiralis]
MAALEPRVIEVPIDNSNDVLEIDCSQLPEHAAEICDILENEGSALRFYHLFALEYYKQGHAEEAVVALKRGIANAKANDQSAKVPLLNLLASIYVQKAKSATTSANGGDRDMLLQMATTLLTEAERINRSEPNIFLVKGVLALAKRQPEAALTQFNTALKLDPSSLASLLGKARVLYGMRQFQHALAIYQQVLTIRPMGKPDVRIGIGLCLYKLGHTEDARLALARAIEVDSTAAAPHILLAAIDLNKVKRSMDPRISESAANPESLDKTLEESGNYLRRAMDHLYSAYELQPDNPSTLIFLADRLFFKADYEGAQKLGEKALNAADTMAIQAEAHYQIARAYHAAKRFDMAYDAYQKCLSINERHSLARYGLGQMQLQRTDMSSAEATFQRVLERHPKCVEVLRALGYLHARLPNTKAKALEYYEKEMQVLAEEATERATRLGIGNSSEGISDWFDDANLFLESGLLYETSSAKKARKSYSMAANILMRTKGPGGAIPELWNNLGALGQLTGDSDDMVFAEYNQAAVKCVEALSEVRLRLVEKKSASGTTSSKSVNEIHRLENTLVTITYNVALFYEHCGLWDKAESLYQKLLEDVPTYIDARLRLAYIAFYHHSSSDAALAHVGQAVELDSKRTSAWLMRGNIELQRKNVQDARRAFEHILKDIAKHDVYALCSLGNYYLAAGKSESTRASNEANATSSTAKKAKELSAQNYKRALEFFDKCLQLDERCALAAHGSAIAMAECGFVNEARRVFQSVRDAATAGLGPASLCNPASELIFKIATKHSLLSAADDNSAPVPLSGASEVVPLVASDVLLWSGVNAAHSYVDVGNYRQAVLAYESCIRRLEETTKILESVNAQSGVSAGNKRFIITVLEHSSQEAPDESNGHATATMTEAERNERSRVKRDLGLYLVRALYIQAKANKDIEAMRTALDLIRDLCTESNIKLPESALSKPASNGTGAEEKVDAEGDVEMKPAASENSESKNEASEKNQRIRLSPDDSLVLFNLALVEQAVAQLASEMPEAQRTLQHLDFAISDLEHSTATFTFLANWGKGIQRKNQKLLYSPRLASERAGFGRSLVTKLQRKKQEQEQLERQRQENFVQWRKQQEAEEERKRQEAEKAEMERLEIEAKLLREAEERNAILREQMAAEAAKQMAEAPVAHSSSSKTKKKARADKDDEFISENDDLDGYYDNNANSDNDKDEDDGVTSERPNASDSEEGPRKKLRATLTRPASGDRKKKRKQRSIVRGREMRERHQQSDDDVDSVSAAVQEEETEKQEGHEENDSRMPRKRRNVQTSDEDEDEEADSTHEADAHVENQEVHSNDEK